MNLAAHIDHTLLRFDASMDEYEFLCIDAIKYGFANVCVPPSAVEYIIEKFGSQLLNICSVIGFPCGYSTLKAKQIEAQELINVGVRELDIVINLLHAHSGMYNKIERELEVLIGLCRENNVISKVIVEIGSLSSMQFGIICEIINKLQADFIKTSTGMLKSGYTVSTNDIKLIRSEIDERIKIKASGGIKTKEQALDLLKAGANRLGTSSSIQIIS